MTCSATSTRSVFGSPRSGSTYGAPASSWLKLITMCLSAFAAIGNTFAVNWLPARLLEQRRILPAVQEVVVRAPRDHLVDDLGLVHLPVGLHREPRHRGAAAAA